MFRTAAVEAFFAAWQALRTDNAIPHYRTIFQNLPSRIIPQLMILEHAGEAYTIRFVGTARAESWGADVTGVDSLSFVSASMAKAARQNFKHLLEHPCGIHQTGLYSTSAGREVETESILLPVANDPGLPGRIVRFEEDLTTVGYSPGLPRVQSITYRQWIDIGFGVPKKPPSKN